MDMPTQVADCRFDRVPAGTDRTGRHLWARPLVAADRDRWLAEFAAASSATIRMRFGGDIDVTGSLIDRLLTADQQAHVAVVLGYDGDGADDPVAVLRVIDDGDGRAEFTVAVADRAHGRGVGRIACQVGWHVAVDVGYRQLWAEVAGTNVAMLTALHVWPRQTRTVVGGLVTVVGLLGPVG